MMSPVCCSQCDVVTVNCPLHDGTQGMFNDELIGKMKKGSYLVNSAHRAHISDVVYEHGTR